MIRQATEEDISAIEEVLLDAARWLEKRGQGNWSAGEVSWKELSRTYQPQDFYLYRQAGVPVGCTALVEEDPFYWPELSKGEALIVHKLAVREQARGTGAAAALLAFAKEQCRRRGISTLRLDCRGDRPRLRAFYESHGFICVKEALYKEGVQSAFYICTVTGD